MRYSITQFGGFLLTAAVASFAMFAFSSYAYADTLFSDGFESGDFSAWDGAGFDWYTVNNASGTHSGNYRAEGPGDASTGSVIVKYVTTAGHDDVALSFWYKIPGNGFEAGEDMDVDYTLGGGVWSNLVKFVDGDEVDEWTEWSGVLPAAANSPDFGIRFQTNAGSASDIFALDDVTLTADVIFQPVGEILAPEADEIVYGDIDLLAVYDDGDDENEDVVNWAVREGTCAAGVNTIFGNVDGYNDAYEWDGMSFSSEMDTSGLTPGMYCFIFNPKDDAGQNDVRETREFYVAGTHINGGGQAHETAGLKKKDWLKVSFGGWVADIGELVGEWQVNLHNVGGKEFDKSKFHGSEIIALNVFDGNSTTCNDAANMTVNGRFDGEDGYSMIMRFGDLGSPNTADTVRVTIYGGINASGGVVYDTHAADEFSDESSCVGTARTGLDAGNITIVNNS